MRLDFLLLNARDSPLSGKQACEVATPPNLKRRQARALDVTLLSPDEGVGESAASNTGRVSPLARAAQTLMVTVMVTVMEKLTQKE